MDINTHIMWTDDLILDLLCIPHRNESLWIKEANLYSPEFEMLTWASLYEDLVNYGSDIAAILNREPDAQYNDILERRLKHITALLNRIKLLSWIQK